MKIKLRLLQFAFLLTSISMFIGCGSSDPEVDCSAVNITISVVNTTDATCADGGSVTVTSEGGEGSVEYSVDGSSFQNSATFDNLDAGNYTVTVRDVNQCTATVSATITSDLGNLTLSITNTTNATCSTGGSLTAEASGGVGTVEYSIDGSSFQASATFDGLDAGNYTVTARDANQCTTTSTAVIADDPGNVAFSASASDSGCGTSQGSITVTASGGDANYQYSIDGVTFGASNTFSNLAQGTYTVVVKDGEACEKSDDVSVLSGTTFSNSIQPIIENSCAVTNCHVANTGRQDFTQFSVIQANAAGIKSRTQSGNMPATGSITQEEIDLLACWVDDGALNN